MKVYIKGRKTTYMYLDSHRKKLLIILSSLKDSKVRLRTTLLLKL